jgi:hypothetical protein
VPRDVTCLNRFSAAAGVRSAGHLDKGKAVAHTVRRKTARGVEVLTAGLMCVRLLPCGPRWPILRPFVRVVRRDNRFGSLICWAQA